MLVACGPAALKVSDGATVLLDADAGLIDLAPSSERLREATQVSAAARKRDATALSTAREPCCTLDGARIEIFANCGSISDARSAVAAGAEGCGLLRTEFLFLDRATAPSEEEQLEAYALIARELDGRPLIVRTLDIGGDKPVPYLPFPHEDNPALGARGIRLGLARPDLLKTQLRAILRGVPAAQCRIMLPMVVDGTELLAVRAMLEEVAASLRCDVPALGVMIETPAAALMAHHLARNAAFLSLGTNDLTQYVLAADRGNPAVASGSTRSIRRSCI
jgi:phosphoenolpyruvate-protein kinase (PTS system EI component)